MKVRLSLGAPTTITMQNPRQPGIKAEASTPMAQMAFQQQGNQFDPKERLPTFIYDYFLKTRRPNMAQALLSDPECDIKTKDKPKPSPNGRDINGDMPKDAIAKRIEEMPTADLSESLPHDSFLQDWFCLFWDMFNASNGKNSTPASNNYNNINNVSSHPQPPSVVADHRLARKDPKHGDEQSDERQ